MQTMENKITLDRIVLAFAFSFIMFMYAELDKKLDKVTYNRNRSETNQVLRALTEDNKKILELVTELKTIVKLKHNVK